MTGGRLDAGDLRKWMDATMMAGFGLMHVARHLGEQWDPARSGLPVPLDEMRRGDRYFLKMQDKDGRVFADTAGGTNGEPRFFGIARVQPAGGRPMEGTV